MTDPVFFKPSPGIPAGELAAAVGAVLSNAELSGVLVDSVSSVEEARAGSLVYVEGPRNVRFLEGTRAAAVLCPPGAADRVPEGVAVLVTERPQLAFAAAARLIYPQTARPQPLTGEAGISAGAHVSPKAVIEEGATVEAGAVVGAGARIGAGTLIAATAVVGCEVRIGRNCHIGAGSSLQHALLGDRVIVHPGARIGQDGFGYVAGRNGPEKMAQIGRVVIQDDVEIGANTTIDRGALSDTVVGEKTKIDNLVQIAHNVTIGRGCIIAGQCGISGSVRIGDYVMIGGAAGLKDHLSIGDGAQIAAGSGLMDDVPAGEKWGGRPAQPIRAHFREVAKLRELAKTGRMTRRRNDRGGNT